VDYAAFLQAAERGQPPPVALLHGTDEQLLDDALDVVTRGLFADPTERALGREVLEGEEVSVEAVTRSAATLPLMTLRRLVIVRRAHLLSARGRDMLAAYARDFNPTTCLLLVADDVLPAVRGRVDHWLLGALPPAAIVGLPIRRGRGVEDWLKQRAAAEGLSIADDAARLLVQWVGDDGARLLGEARKAALVGGSDNHRVGVTEVTAVVGEQRVSAAFDLSRAVERRDLAQALRLLDQLLTTEDAMPLLALLTRSVRIAAIVRALAARGQSSAQIAPAVRPVPVPAIEAMMARVAAVSEPTLLAQLERCWQAEWRCKSGGEPRAELTALVADLCTAR
jgi:DNA polymerase III subunit delta